MSKEVDLYLFDIKTQKITKVSQDYLCELLSYSRSTIYRLRKQKKFIKQIDCFILDNSELNDSKLLCELINKDKDASFVDKEFWKHSPLIDDRYLVSNEGRLKRVCTNGKEIVMRFAVKKHPHKDYITVQCINNTGDRKLFKLKQLVYTAFNYGKYNKGDIISHKDNDIYNCSCDNLYIPNREDIHKNSLKNRKIKNYVIQLDQITLVPIAIYHSAADVQRYIGLDQSGISKAAKYDLHEQCWQAVVGGYRWQRIKTEEELEKWQDKYEYLEIKPIKRVKQGGY